ncbi:MAG: RNA polymerase sigma-70 factor [Bacteroidota bacterium]|nr:RNA polymerase sigma-70 factor [Bacteroidota bacterium]
MDQIEKEILKGIQSNDQKSYGYLIQLYFHPATLYAKSIVLDAEIAKEIVQDVFLKIWNLRSTLEINSSLKAYLYQMTHNLCIDYLRSKANKRNPSIISYDDLKMRLDIFELEDHEPFFEKLFSDQMESAIHHAIEELPEQCREIFILNRYKQLTYPQISKKLNISLSTTKTQMVRAMHKLKEALIEFL